MKTNQTATEEDTNVPIECDLSIERSAPFWRINENVYDLFHVPIYFRVDSFSFLTIPMINLSFDGYTFQCILINHMTDPVTEVPGRITQLSVRECEFLLL